MFEKIPQHNLSTDANTKAGIPRGAQYFFHTLSILVILVFIWLTLQIQNKLFFNWDISWLLHVTQQFLAGKKYFSDFFESNPPLILYIYSIPVLIAKWFGLKLFVTFRYSLISLILVFLAICAALLKRLEIDYYAYLITILLAAVWLLLPSYELGQKDQIMTILIMPYLLMITLQIKGKRLAPSLRYLIILFATIGFSIKPYFFIAWCWVEIYYCIQMRNWRTLFRLDNWFVCLLVILYLVSIWIFARAYYTQMLPFILHDYINLHPASFSRLIENSYALLLGITSVLLILFMRKHKLFPLLMIWMGVGICFYCVFVYEGEMWYYHIYPSFVFATLNAGILFFAACQYLGDSHQLADIFMRLSIAFWLGVILLIPAMNTLQLTQKRIQFKSNQDSRLNQLIQTTNTLINQANFMVFSTTFDIAQIINNQSKAHFVGRFPYYLYVVGILRDEAHPNPSRLAFAHYAKQVILKGTVADLARYNPALLIVDVRKHKPYSDALPIDFIAFLKQSHAFRQQFSVYHFVRNVAGFNFYRRNPQVQKTHAESNYPSHSHYPDERSAY